MPTTKSIQIEKLNLDLLNFRTIPQESEIKAIQSMIAISPDRFWALMDSLLDDGYLPTENILVLSDPESAKMVVKEGNRRIAALKLIYEQISDIDIDFPEHIQKKISALSQEWKETNKLVPCAVYEVTEVSMVDKIVTLAHGKGEKAGRDQWTAVARARHNRNVNRAQEPALDLLEKYLKQGKNLTPSQSERWSGDYPLSVLDESIKKLSTRFGVTNAPELADKYPNISHREALEKILQDIGLAVITFPVIRNSEDFAASYGLPPPAPNIPLIPQRSPKALSPISKGPSPKKKLSVATNDPRIVKKALREFSPLGNNREKVVTLRDEALRLDLHSNPLAFCFLLRSMFEISSKAYCDDHQVTGGPSYTKSDGNDRKLVDVLRDINSHLINSSEKEDKVIQKTLHGAMTELEKPEGILSVTSMNQLVHNPKFSITAGDIATVFGNIFPLLKMMNQ